MGSNRYAPRYVLTEFEGFELSYDNTCGSAFVVVSSIHFMEHTFYGRMPLLPCRHRAFISARWRYGVVNQWQLEYLFSSLARLTTKKSSTFRITGPLWGGKSIGDHWIPITGPVMQEFIMLGSDVTEYFALGAQMLTLWHAIQTPSEPTNIGGIYWDYYPA